jgi:hypothetical protein
MKVRDLKSYGIILLPPGHPHFEAAVEQALGDKRSDLAKAVKNISVVIRNNSDKTVIGYSLKWQFKAADGKEASKEFRFVQSGALLDGGSAKNPPNLPGSILIRPEGQRLVSVFASLGADSPPGPAPHPDVQQRIEQFTAMANQSSEVIVVLDCILFEDGTFAGPNESHFLEEFVQSFDVLQEFYQHLARLADTSASESEITAWVKTKMDTLPIADNSKFNRHVAASEFLAVRDRFGLAEAISLAKSKLYKHRPDFTNISQH